MKTTINNLITAVEAAEIIGVTSVRVRRIALEGRLATIELGGRKFFDRKEVERFSRLPRPTGRPKKKFLGKRG